MSTRFEHVGMKMNLVKGSGEQFESVDVGEGIRPATGFRGVTELRYKHFSSCLEPLLYQPQQV
jgi:hypothetical protein